MSIASKIYGSKASQLAVLACTTGAFCIIDPRNDKVTIDGQVFTGKDSVDKALVFLQGK